MNKKSTRPVIYLLLVIVFNAIFFLISGTDHNVSGWISYGFIYVALVVSFIAPLVCINYKRIPENLSTIYGTAWLYSIISIIINSIIIATDFVKTSWCIVINIVMLAIYLIQLIINVNVNKSIEQRLENTDSERQYVHDLSNILKNVMNEVSDSSTKKNIEKAYDIVRTSPINSNESVMEIELEVTRLVNELADKAQTDQLDEINNIAVSIQKLANKRNMMLR